MSKSIAELAVGSSSADAARERRHRAWILLLALAAAALAVALTLYGFDYYRLDQVHRPHSPKHAELRPGGVIGIRLGILGIILLFLIYLYPIRKRWAWLGSKGSTQHWFDYHILLGLVAPVVVSFHASFKAQGLAGLAYWTMAVLTASGIIGRYLYAQIPRSRAAAESSLKRLEASSTQRSREVEAAAGFAEVVRLPDIREVQAMSSVRALWLMLVWDLGQPMLLWKVRRRLSASRGLLALGGVLSTGDAALETAIHETRRQVVMTRRILLLSRAERIFHLWHVLHRPFSVSLAILVLLHLAIVFLFGYY